MKRIFTSFLCFNLLLFTYTQQIYSSTTPNIPPEAAAAMTPTANGTPQAAQVDPNAISTLGENVAQEKEHNDDASVSEGKTTSDINIAKSVITLVTVIVAGFIAGLVGVGCRSQCFKVPSVVIFIAVSALYLVQEAVFFIVYQTKLKDLKDALSAQEIKSDQDYNGQLDSAKKLRDMLEAGFQIELAKSIILTALSVAYGAAEVAAIAETVMLKAAYSAYKTAYAGFFAANKALMGVATSMTTGTTTYTGVGGGVLNQISGLANTFIILKPDPTGTPQEEGQPETPDYSDTVADKTDAIASSIDAMKQEYNIAKIAGENSAKIAVNTETDVVGGNAAQALFKAADTALDTFARTLSTFNKTTKALAKVRRYTVLTCKSLTKVDTTPTTASFWPSIFGINNAYAGTDATSIIGIITMVGIVAAPVVGVVLAVKKVQILKADSMLYHPLARAIFIGVILALVVTSTGLTLAASVQMKQRAAKIQALIDRLEKLTGMVRPTNPHFATGGAGLDQTAQTYSQEDTTTTIGPDTTTKIADSPTCVGQDGSQDAKCTCKTTNTCFQNTSFSDMKYDFAPHLNTTDLQSINKTTNDSTSLLAQGQIGAGVNTAKGMISYAAMIKQKRSELLDKLSKVEGGKNYIQYLNQERKKALDEIQKNTIALAKNVDMKDSKSGSLNVLSETGNAKADLSGQQTVEDLGKKPGSVASDKNAVASAGGATGGAAAKEMKEENLDDTIKLDAPTDDDLSAVKADGKLDAKDAEGNGVVAKDLSELDLKNVDVNVQPSESIFNLLSRRYQNWRHRMFQK